MKNKTTRRIFIIVLFFCISFFMYININKYFLIPVPTKYFEEFYSEHEVDLLKNNIIAMKKTVNSANYIVSIRGVWAQENGAILLFEICPVNGSTIDEENIHCSIRNTEKVDDENGSLSLGEWKYRIGNEKNGLLSVKYISEEPIKELTVKIEIKDEQFIFKTPISGKEKMNHFIPVDNSDNYSFQEIYLSSMAVYWVKDNADTTNQNNEIYINYTNGTDQKINISDSFVSQEDGDIKMYIQFLDNIYDMNNIETISVGNEKYKPYDKKDEKKN